MNEPPSPGPLPILTRVARYYAEKLERFGATAAGVDWNSTESQHLRFLQLLRVGPEAGGQSVNDYGCGYGALADYLRDTGRHWDYRGFDISESMVARARVLHDGVPTCSFTSDVDSLAPADYTLASGIFNVTLGSDPVAWREYVIDTLTTLNRLSVKAFAFNMLSTYSDMDRRRSDLFYGDPLFFFDVCKRRFSPRVALLHDYPLYEFTVIVRK
jgi:SAM-dependent methyltransferase